VSRQEMRLFCVAAGYDTAGTARLHGTPRNVSTFAKARAAYSLARTVQNESRRGNRAPTGLHAPDARASYSGVARTEVGASA